MSAAWAGRSASQRLGKQSESLYVTGLDGTEVTAIEGRHLGHFEPFRDCDEACVSPAEGQSAYSSTSSTMRS